MLLPAAIITAQNNNGILNKFSLAENYENTGDLQKATKLYEDLYLANPDNNVFFESLNGVYLKQKNYAASVNLIERQIKKNPDDINLYGLLGSTYYLMGNEEKAYEVWDEPFTFMKPNPVLYSVIANYAVQRRAFDKAIDIYEKGKEAAGDKITFSYNLAQLYSITMQFKKAAEEYCNILAKNPAQLQTIQTKLLANANKPDALKVTISVVENYAGKDNLSFSYLLARLYIENKDYEKAFDMYVDIDNRQSQKGRELYKYAEFLFREKQYSLAKDVYEKIIGRYPESPLIASSKLGYAKALEAILMNEYADHVPAWKPYFPIVTYESEKIDDVIAAFKDVADVYKHSEASYEALLRIGMIKFYLLNKQDEAKSYFNKVINEASLSGSAADAYRELGKLALLNGNLTGAERNFAKITILSKIDLQKITDAKYNLARIKFYEGDIKSAQKLLADIMKNLKDDNANDAIGLSLLMNTSKNDSSNLLLFAEAEFLADQKKFTQAADKYKMIAGNPRAFIFHSVASLRTAEMMLALSDYQQAIKLFENVVEEGEKNIYADKALYLLGEIYQYGLGDGAKAIEIYEKLLAKFPLSIYIDEARERIRNLKEKIS
ncbi:tetratricopeptide repeat protein [bacterium BMS3Abin03]|nr:tetratricopeptide repeat protein [bacterium BMS3Abin03]